MQPSHHCKNGACCHQRNKLVLYKARAFTLPGDTIRGERALNEERIILYSSNATHAQSAKLKCLKNRPTTSVFLEKALAEGSIVSTGTETAIGVAVRHSSGVSNPRQNLVLYTDF